MNEREYAKELEKALEKYPMALKVTEVAEILRVSKFLVYRMINEKKISAITIGRERRISKNEVLYFLVTGKSLCSNPNSDLIDESEKNSWTLEKVCDMCCVTTES